ncbi:DUF6438 domain-containing protein [Nodosilinea sp. AN01ver1]|uniref:DUF6438 domain-containing protein n=1 Tax=Nodosilinea sp. AN01ver1 TaxID=3423362 RepID=UPI003D314851
MNIPPKIHKLTFSRGMCFGSCPVYTVELSSDGQVLWFGEYYVNVLGRANWSVPLAQVAEIEQTLHHVRFQRFAAAYDDSDITCQPSSQISVVYLDGATKTVSHDHGDFSAPEALTLLEDCLDDLMGTAPYVGSTDCTD